MNNFYAYQNNSEIVNSSSSGGAFSRIVEALVDKYGENKIIVYGAVWNDLNVEYRRYPGYSGLSYFRKSKYIKAKLDKVVLTNIIKDLNNGYFVVFSGIPCQVDAVKKTVLSKTKKIDNLFLVDIICHGAPNNTLFDDYVKYIENKYHSKIKSIDFRDKKKGWKGYKTKIELSNGRVLFDTYDSNLYMRLFFSHYGLSKGCFSCPYSNMLRISDVTIGDWWGIEQEIPQFPVNSGVSLVLANSEKGKQLFNEIKELKTTSEIVEGFSSPIFLKYQHNLKYPTEKPTDYDYFWTFYRKNGFKKTIKTFKLHNLNSRIKTIIKKIIINLCGDLNE